METLILDFFKTFADANRLRLAALLLDHPSSVEEIASHLKVRVSDVPRLLGQMERLNLVVRENGRYRMDSKALEQLSREVLSGMRQAPAETNDQNADDFDRSVVRNYTTPEGRLKEIPTQEKKLMPILRHVVQVFAPGQRYTEKEVNIMLARFYPDAASLRRYLIDRQLLKREKSGATYWRETGQEAGQQTEE